MNTIALDMMEPVDPRNRKYKITIEKEMNGKFIATVSAIPGCSGRGETIEEALTVIRAVIILYIQECHRLGKEIPEDSDL